MDEKKKSYKETPYKKFKQKHPKTGLFCRKMIVTSPKNLAFLGAVLGNIIVVMNIGVCGGIEPFVGTVIGNAIGQGICKIREFRKNKSYKRATVYELEFVKAEIFVQEEILHMQQELLNQQKETQILLTKAIPSFDSIDLNFEETTLLKNSNSFNQYHM